MALSDHSRKVMLETQFCRELDDHSVSLFMEELQETSYSRQTMIISEGETIQKLFFVTEGIAKINKISPDGKEQTITLIRNGDYFNETTLVDSFPSIYNVEAIVPVRVCYIPNERLINLMNKNSSIMTATLRLLSNRIRYLISLVEDLSFRSVTGRVAKILLAYINTDALHAKIITQRDMAAMAGTAREVVSRALKSLEDEGYIEINHGKIQLIDIKGLQDLVDLVE